MTVISKAIIKTSEVLSRLRKIHGSVKPAKDVLVGYTANYAVYVHENLEARHTNGQAKFLEKPLREMRDELGRVIEETYAATGNLTEALMTAGLRLQRESQELVPVDTGNLKNSAFTRPE